jgi:hypothetical protein
MTDTRLYCEGSLSRAILAAKLDRGLVLTDVVRNGYGGGDVAYFRPGTAAEIEDCRRRLRAGLGANTITDCPRGCGKRVRWLLAHGTGPPTGALVDAETNEAHDVCVPERILASETPGDTYHVKGDMQAVIRDCLDVCALRGWSLHWTARGAYLHLESSELIEAWRGKGKSTVAQEAGDVLLVLFSILGASETRWDDALRCATEKIAELRSRPRYPGEEYSDAATDG